MATNIEKITEEVFNVLKGYGEKLTLFNQQGTKVFKPIEATKIYCQNSGTMLSIDDYGVNSTLSVSISGNTDVTQFKPIIQTLKKLAIKYNVLFDLKKFNKELKPKDFMFDLKEAFGDSKYIEFSKDYYEKLYGKPEDYDEIEYKNEVLGFAKLIENILAGKLKYNKRTPDLNPTIVDKLTYFSNNKTKIDNRLFKNFVKSVATKTLNNRVLTNFEKLFSEKLITIYDNEVLKKDKPLEEEKIFENWFNEKNKLQESISIQQLREASKKFQEVFLAAEDLRDTAKKCGKRLKINHNGTVTVYHRTHKDNVEKIKENGFFKSSFFAFSEKETLGHTGQYKNNETVVMKCDIDPRDLSLSTGTCEFYSEKSLIYNNINNTWSSVGLYENAETRVTSETINVDGKQRPTRNSHGKLIHPTIEGITNFWKWFGDSKVVDADGKPFVVYHGTKAKFDAFDIDKAKNGWAGKGFYFGQNKSLASDFGSRTIKAYLNIKNPFLVTGNSPSDILSEVKSRYPEADDLNLPGVLEGYGFDGVKFTHWDSGEMYIAFNPAQIKSAIGNKGTFSPNSKTITESEEIPETIGVDGRVYPTRNSKGEYIANTEQAIVNFYKWFDDSKMVDNQGRPLVMYHGTDYEFEDFDESHLGKNHGSVSKIGFWFTDDEQYAKFHGSNIKTAYLKAYTPKIVKSVGSIKSSDKQQYDSIIQHPSKEKLGRFEVDNAGIYCVFDKNQIKSIKNLNEDIAEIPYVIEVGGKQRPTRNSENQLIYPTIEGINNFWNWFGESTAVDRQGRPLVLYHGSPDARFMKTSPTFMSMEDRYGEKKGVGAFWFAKHRKTASSYADDRRAFDYQNAEPAIISCYLKMENPLIVEADGKEWREAQQRGKTTDVIEKAKSSSHDAVIIKNVRDDYNNSTKTASTDTYVVFDSLHIKSLHNNGDFSTNSKKITESEEIPEKITVDGKLRWTTNSNGKLIHPTIQGIENFWKWFGDSKVVDNQGRPRVVYHGTRANFDTFDSSFERSDKGFWFASIDKAEGYSKVDRSAVRAHREEPDYTGANIMPVYMCILNPIYYSKIKNNEDIGRVETVKLALKNKNDGIIFDDVPIYDDVPTFVAFSPKQIKSAIGNNGDFSTNSTKITESTDIKANDTIQISYNNNLYTVGYVGKKENYVYVKTKSNKVKKIPADKFVLVTNFSEKPSITIGGDMSDNIIKKIT